MAEMGKMMSIIAHQWKQPLNVISLIVQDVVMSYEDGTLNTADALEKLESTVDEQISFMAETINDFRNYFKPSKEKREFTVSEAVSEVTRLLSAKMKKHNIEIDCIKDDKILIFGVINEFKQVVLNIINNAIDAIEEKSISEGKIGVTIEAKTDIVVVKISDNAGGILEELLPDRLFQSYITTKGESGTGIGLEISKKIIESNMGGSLYAHNIESGAEFVIELPIKKIV
jgi:signal transduction histidine kinase